MGEVFRRVIMLPPDLPGSVRADLERNLAAAVIFQNRLADQSPFVLRLYDKFCTDGQNIFIDHEPAKPLDIRALFDPDLEKCTASEWLAVASGLLEALAQIESSGEPSRPHGGIAPGVVLSTDAGLWKVTDFRFAPTICETLGIASYLNLAVGPPAGAEPGVVVTGAWEILPESEDGRDDRICAFIDPQKFAGVSEHGERVFAAFEGGSDMVAAGMIIALFAEHLHPFLGGMRDAHRVVDMASFMGSALATPIRRKDFIESSDEAVVALRDQLKNMLQRLPKDRPRASAAAAALRPFYKDKLDFTSIRHRQDEAEADRWLKGLEELLEASAWSELEKSLGSPPSVQVWPERVSRRLEQIKKKAGEFSNAERVASQRAADGEAASAWFGEFSAAISAESWNEAREIHRRKPTLQFWPGDTLKLLAPLESQLQAEIKRLDDHNIARKWISEIGQSIELGDWTSAEKRLAARPSIDNWPSEVLEQAAARTEQVRSQLDLIKVQHQQAKRWVAEARQAIKNSAHGRAIEILNQRPAIQYWPDKLLDEAAQLIEQCGDRIGDEVVAQLQHHLTFVERAARAFLKEVVDGTFQDTLDAATLSLMIDSDQILSEDSMNRGRAVMVVSLPAKPDVKESPALRVPFEYDLDQKSRPISDPDRRVQSQIVESMGSQLAGLQAKSIPDFAARLKKGLFPNASLRMDHKGYGSKAKAVFAYSKDPKDTLNLTLAWDLRRMEWTLSDADALATRLAERISSSARARVLESVIGEAPLLAEYQAQLQVELDLPEASTNLGTTPILFRGRLSLKIPTERDPALLHALEGEIKTIDRVELSQPVSAAEGALKSTLVDHQERSRQAALEAVTAATGGGKAKVTVNPKRIKSPTAELSIEIKMKGEPTRTVTARWNPSRFAYDVEALPAASVPAQPPARAEPAAKPAPMSVAEEKRESELPREKAPSRERASSRERDSAGDVKSSRDGLKDQSYGAQARTKKSPGGRRKAFIGGGVAAALIIAGTVAYSLIPVPGNGEKLATNTNSASENRGQNASNRNSSSNFNGRSTGPEKSPVAVDPKRPEQNENRVANAPRRSDPAPEPAYPLREVLNDRPAFLKFAQSMGAADSALVTFMEPTWKEDSGKTSKSASADVAVFGKPIRVEAAFEYGSGATDFHDPTWKVISDQAALNRLVEEAKISKTEAIRVVSDEGNLVKAVPMWDQLAKALEELRADPRFAEVNPEMEIDLPPLFDASAFQGYDHGEPDTQTGYPVQLTEKASRRVLKLVTAWPNDETWNGMSETSHGWRIFYIDAKEWSEDIASARGKPKAFDEARAIASTSQPDLRPTQLPLKADLWLAALKLREDGSANSNWFGGLYEWCADAVEESSEGLPRHLATGGCYINISNNVPRMPKADAPVTEWIEWLAHPLVTQNRAFPDDLVGFRRVLNVHPVGTTEFPAGNVTP